MDNSQDSNKPVAWMRKSDLVELRACNYMRLGADSPSIWAPNAPDEPSPDMELVAVYTSPQPAQRTWVGLSEEERRSIREWQRIQEELGPVWSPMMLYLYEAIEAKLRSKNEDRN